MDENKHEELISAYLDGELDAAEHAWTAKWIAEDPRAQKLLQELQGLQEALRTLPQHRLEKNLTQPVLEQIDPQPVEALYSMVAADMQSEKVMCAMAPPMDALVDPTTLSKTRPKSEKPRDHDRRRLYLWPAVAIAAAVLLMVFSSREPVEEDRSVARSDLGAGQESAMIQEATPPSPSTVVMKSKSQPLKLSRAAPGQQRSSAQARTGGDRGRPFAKQAAPVTEADAVLELNEPQVSSQSASDGSSVAFAPDRTHLVTTYVFKASPKIDIKSQLQTLVRESGKVKVIDLGMAPADTSSPSLPKDYRVFDLYGDPEATYTMIKALKNVSGLTFNTQKKLPREDSPNRSEKNKDAITKFQRRETKEAVASPVLNHIRLIFIVSPSRSQLPKR